MMSPVELRTGGGRVFLGPPAMIPAPQRAAFPPIDALSRIFRDPETVGQLRREWAGLGLGGGRNQHLTASEMRAVVERALARDRLSLLWIPPVPDAPIVVAVDPKPKAPPPPLAAGNPQMPARTPPPPPISSLNAAEKIHLALGKALALLDKAAGDRLPLRQALAKLAADEALRLRVSAFFAKLAPRGAGEIAARPLFAWACQLLGFEGVKAAQGMVTAAFDAAEAGSDDAIDGAATRFAEAFGVLGAPFPGWLATRLQAAPSQGGRKEGGTEDGLLAMARKAIDDPASFAKVVKDAGQSYAAQMLEKAKAAANQAKSAAEDDLMAGVKKAVTDVAGEKAGAMAGALLDKAREEADKKLQEEADKAEAAAMAEAKKAADKAEAAAAEELKKAADAIETVVTEEGMALVERYLSEEEIDALKKLAGEEAIERLRQGGTDPEDLAFYKEQLIEAAKREGEKAARNELAKHGVPDLPA